MGRAGAAQGSQCTIIAHVLHLTIFITYFLEKQEYINVCKNLFEIHLFISWMQLVQLLWKDAANKPRTENALQRERRERDMAVLLTAAYPSVAQIDSTPP